MSPRPVPLPPQGPHDASVTLARAQQQIEQAARDNPYGTVAVAFGVGLVLGGGLPRWAARLAIQAGARIAVGKVVAAALTPRDG